MNLKRLISVILLMSVVLSACFVSIPLMISAENSNEFVAEHYKTDFSVYTGKSGGNELASAPDIYWGEFTGSVSNIQTSVNPLQSTQLWDRIKSSDATGGYYLSLNKTADLKFPSKAITNKWISQAPKTYLNFVFDKDGYGIYSKSNKNSALVLKNDTVYIVKIRYRVNELSEGTELQFYGGHATDETRLVSSDKTTSSQNNDVVLNTIKSKTDGWITEEYIYHTPKKYVGTAFTSVFGWYPVKDNKFDATSSFSVDTDFVEVTRASAIEVYSGEDVIDTVYAAPGTTLNVSSIERPIKAGYKFAGWFTDAELTIPANTVNIVEKAVSAKLYVSWAEAVKSADIDADSYPNALKNNQNVFNGFTFSTSAYTGTNVFSVANDAFMQLCDSDGQPLAITNGNTYIMSFWYKGTVNGDAKVAFVISDENGLNLPVTQGETVLDSSNEWKRLFVSFKANGIKTDEDILYLTFTGNGNIYIDDIKLATTSKIHFEMNGADAIGDLEGLPGNDALLSDALWTGHKFCGWYFDKEFEKKCTEIKFPINTDSVTLYAAWDIVPPTAFMDFENTPYDQWSVQGGYYLSSFAEITESDAFAGKKSLFFAYIGGSGKNSSSTNSVAFYNNTEKVYSGENKTYAVSFWYKAKKLDTNIRVSVMTSYQNNWYAEAHAHFAGAAIISKDDAVGEWTKKTFYFTSNPEKDENGIYDFMYLRIDALEDKNAEIYIDNVSLQKYDGEKSLLTLAYDDSTSEYHSVNTGDVITLPSPTRENYRFIGWFSDSELKNKVENEYKVTGNTVLYAKWQLLSTTMVFDDFPEAWAKKSSGNTKFTSRVDLVNDGGNTVLEFKGNKWEGALTQMYQAGTSNTISAVVGDCYRVKVRYKVKSGAAALRIITAVMNNGYAFPKTQGEILLKSDEKDVWQEAVGVFKIQKSEYSTFHFSFSADEDNTDVCIDDATVEALPGYSFTKFVLNNDKNPIYSIAKPGDKIVFPTNISRENYQFGNWCADENLTEQFNATVTSSEPITAYARWILISTIMKFDDYPEKWADLTIKGNLKFSKRTNLESVDGNVALGFKGNNWETGLAQMYEAGTSNLIRAAFGKYYRVTFRYMVNSGAANLEFITAGANNGYAKPCVQGKYELKSYQSGVWKETEYVFKTKSSTYDTLHFKFSATTDNTDVYIDDFKIEMLDNIAITSFVPNNGEDTKYAFGKTGDSFTYPTVKRNGYEFAGWYSDSGLIEKYDGRNFTKEPLTLYAKWILKDKLKVSFEDVFYKTIKSEQKYTIEVTDKYSYDGKHAALMDKSKEVKGKYKNAYILLAYDNLPIELEDNVSYIITYKYLALKNSDYEPSDYSGKCLTINARTSALGSGWAKSTVYDGKHTFGTYQDIGVWMTGSYIITTDFADPESRYLYFVCDYSDTSSYCFDDITIEKVNRKSGENVVNFNPLGATDIGNTSLYYVGQTGKNVKLPTSIKRTGYSLFGWYEDPDLTKKIEGNDYQILYSDKTLYAGWVKNSVIQNFENVKDIFNTEKYCYIDKDYEVYNTAVSGHSKANVKSGNYSIHRKGNEFRFAAFNPLVNATNGTGTLVSGAGYHLSMWVKMDKHNHTDGAVEIANCNGELYPWSTIGDWKKIYAIKDLADGEWHNITFDFIATASYLSIKTPGNLSIYFDDVSLNYMPELKADDCSKQVEVTEYVPKRHETIKTFLNSALDTSLIKHAKSAVDNTKNDNKTANKLIIALAAVVGLAGIGGGTFVIVSKRKRKGSSK